MVPIPDEQLAIPKVPKTVVEDPDESKPVKTHEAKIIHPRRRKVDAPVKPKCKKGDEAQVIKDDTGKEVDVDDNGCQQIKTVKKEPETTPEETDDPQVIQKTKKAKELDPGNNKEKIMSNVSKRSKMDVDEDGNWMVKNNSPARAKPLHKESSDQFIKKPENTEG